MIIVRVGLASGRSGLPVFGVDSVDRHSDLEFAATNPQIHPSNLRGPRRDTTGVELKSMTVDLTAVRDVDGVSMDGRDVKLHGTLGTSSAESETPRKSRSSL